VYFSGSWFDDFYPTSYMFLSVPAALAGTLVGKKYIQKVNHSRMSLIVGIALFAMGLSMLLGSLTPFH
jgi:uncharacterized membrane protein YfcA